MSFTALAFFDEILAVHNEPMRIDARYALLRPVLEQASVYLTEGTGLEFPNLFSRIGYLAKAHRLSKKLSYSLNTFRIHANKVLHEKFVPGQDEYLADLKALCESLSEFYDCPVPETLLAVFPDSQPSTEVQRPVLRYKERIRLLIDHLDETCLYGYDEDAPSMEPIKVRCKVAGLNEAFNDTFALLKAGDLVNLLDSDISEDQSVSPRFVILRPDYLIDVTTISECFKEQGASPQHFLTSRLSGVEKSWNMLLGDVANYFLDQLVLEDPFNQVLFGPALRGAFRQKPFDFSACLDLPANFNETCKKHFNAIEQIRNITFANEKVVLEDCLLEPSFFCESLGIQARVDLMMDDASRLVELKSGKANTFAGPLRPKESHYVQVLLYLAVLERNLGKNSNRQAYILYSTHEKLLPVPGLDELLKSALNIRNQIVATEYRLAKSDFKEREVLIASVNLETTLSRAVSEKFLDDHIKPQFFKFISPFKNWAELEKVYFLEFLGFASREHFLSKTGSGKSAEELGMAGLWSNSFQEKLLAGTILIDLRLDEQVQGNGAANELDFLLPAETGMHNFRQGDIVVLYLRKNEADQVTNRVVFRCNILRLDGRHICVRLKQAQPPGHAFRPGDTYALEPDFMDSTHGSQYRGLYAFLQCPQHRRDLLLNKRQPGFDSQASLLLYHDTAEDRAIDTEMLRILNKARQASDYFLLTGPPGTGKTSRALRLMVQEFYASPDCNILLIAYTNRAIDEICDALLKLDSNLEYVRFGSSLSCPDQYKSKLLPEVLADCNNTARVKEVIGRHRIFVGNLAALGNQMDLFKIKTFQVAIIDEASQILEPQMLALLSAVNPAKGKEAVEKFILIGDCRQLPAVVLQDKQATKNFDQRLRITGLDDMRNSFFERLLSLQQRAGETQFSDQLRRQGRMHPDIAAFPNYAFYRNELEPVPLEHQQADIQFSIFDPADPVQVLIAKSRIAFISSEAEAKAGKTNDSEAKIISRLVAGILALCKCNDLHFVCNEGPTESELSMGIITPYRHQITLIRSELDKLDLPDSQKHELSKISIDTVERYQGSQRDIILFSFAVNRTSQIESLQNLVTEADGMQIDRKLNVAITRARKHFFMTGDPYLLSHSHLYANLLEFIRSRNAFIDCSPSQFIAGDFRMLSDEDGTFFKEELFLPGPEFLNVFNRLVTEPVKNDPRTSWPERILGQTKEANIHAIGRGTADFGTQQSLLGFSLDDKVNLYCFYNMRRHYFSALAQFKAYGDYFRNLLPRFGCEVCFMDIGCGPMTAGLAFQESFGTLPGYIMHYAGIDVALPMLAKAEAFARSLKLRPGSTCIFKTRLNDLGRDYLDTRLSRPCTVVFNFSYLFANLNIAQAEQLANDIRQIMEEYPLNIYLVCYQNSAIHQKNETYRGFKRGLKNLKEVQKGKVQEIMYQHQEFSGTVKTEKVFFELLSSR